MSLLEPQKACTTLTFDGLTFALLCDKQLRTTFGFSLFFFVAKNVVATDDPSRARERIGEYRPIHDRGYEIEGIRPRRKNARTEPELGHTSCPCPILKACKKRE